MKPSDKPKYRDFLREGENPGKPTKKERKPKLWVKEYQWQSEKDFNRYPKRWGERHQTYTPDWKLESWVTKYPTPEAVRQSLLSELRSPFWESYLKGRNWRAHNLQTGEIVEFPDIENHYK